MIKLAVFDFDATLMDGETIDFLAEAHGVGEEVKGITDWAMHGELDFYESLCKRVSLLKGLPYATAQDVCHNLPLMNGAQECITELKKAGIMAVCFSGGFRLATRYFASKLGLDADFSNTLHIKPINPLQARTNHIDTALLDDEPCDKANYVLSGNVGGEMMFHHSKGNLLARLQHLLGISEKETLAVGDGANDISMLKRASYAVAFCAKPTIKQHANIIIDNKDLCLILPHLPL